jgi:hypothetical protein
LPERTSFHSSVGVENSFFITSLQIFIEGPLPPLAFPCGVILLLARIREDHLCVSLRVLKESPYYEEHFTKHLFQGNKWRDNFG